MKPTDIWDIQMQLIGLDLNVQSKTGAGKVIWRLLLFRHVLYTGSSN